jgi:hypothetical protein
MLGMLNYEHLIEASKGDINDETRVLEKDIAAAKDRVEGIAEKKEGPRKVARMKAKMKKV